MSSNNSSPRVRSPGPIAVGKLNSRIDPERSLTQEPGSEEVEGVDGVDASDGADHLSQSQSSITFFGCSMDQRHDQRAHFRKYEVMQSMGQLPGDSWVPRSEEDEVQEEVERAGIPFSQSRRSTTNSRDPSPSSTNSSGNSPTSHSLRLRRSSGYQTLPNNWTCNFTPTLSTIPLPGTTDGDNNASGQGDERSDRHVRFSKPRRASTSPVGKDKLAKQLPLQVPLPQQKSASATLKESLEPNSSRKIEKKRSASWSVEAFRR